MARCSSNSSKLFPWSLLFSDRLSPSIFIHCRNESLGSLPTTGFKCIVRDEADRSRPTERRRVVPQVYLRHNLSVCYNRNDVCYDSRDRFNCSRCIDGTVISPAQLCDGIVDCADLSDECNCQRTVVRPLCEAAANGSVAVGKVCDGDFDHPTGIDETFCDSEVVTFDRDGGGGENSTVETPRSAEASRKICARENETASLEQYCDGTIDCPETMVDECTSECFAKVIKYDEMILAEMSGNWHVLERYIANCFGSLGVFYNGTLYYGGQSGKVIDVYSDCLNVIDFYERFDDLSAYFVHHTTINCASPDDMPPPQTSHPDLNFLCERDTIACPWLHVCRSEQKQKIGVDRLCDHVNDCANGSDEMECRDTHFYCTGQQPLHIPIELKTDGKSHCADRSDECVETQFSSVEQMIKSAPLRVYIWISAALILLSNGLILYKHVKKLKTIKSRKTIAYCNTFALSNLAVSDAIFGLTLVSIGAKSAQYSGVYCQSDLEWRSGLQCQLTGFLTVVSSQTSMNLLLLMTSLRLYVTLKPFMTNLLNLKVVYSLVALSWLVPLAVAALPILYHRTFVSSVYIEPNLFLNDHVIAIDELRSYVRSSERIRGGGVAKNELDFSVNDLDSWYFGTPAGRSEFPQRQVVVKGSFGFYSSSSVCFPNFYSQEMATANYSLLIIIYNLVCLFVIISGYIVIFKITNKSKKSMRRSTTAHEVNNRKVMRRIVYIIITDILCWLPIIIMSLMSYGGYKLPDIAHTLSTIVFLPINSFLNPVIYSRLDRSIVRMLTKLFTTRASTPVRDEGRNNGDVGNNAVNEIIEMDNRAAALPEAPGGK